MRLIEILYINEDFYVSVLYFCCKIIICFFKDGFCL